MECSVCRLILFPCFFSDLSTCRPLLGNCFFKLVWFGDSIVTIPTSASLQKLADLGYRKLYIQTRFPTLKQKSMGYNMSPKKVCNFFWTTLPDAEWHKISYILYLLEVFSSSWIKNEIKNVLTKKYQKMLAMTMRTILTNEKRDGIRLTGVINVTDSVR